MSKYDDAVTEAKRVKKLMDKARGKNHDETELIIKTLYIKHDGNTEGFVADVETALEGTNATVTRDTDWLEVKHKGNTYRYSLSST